MKIQQAAPIGFAIIFLLASNTSARQATETPGPGAGAANAPMINTIIDEPVSFTTQSEIQQTLADSTHVTRISSKNRSFRDSEGRTRLEVYRNTKTPGSGDQVLIQVIITDPVAGTGYSLNPEDHTAQEILHPQPRILVASVPKIASPSGQARSTPGPGAESLGTQTMEGLLVEGTRTTRTLPAGASGNDSPLTIVTERWVSADLHLPVLTKTTNPLIGDQTIRVFNIDQSEPDPELFQVPADYTVQLARQ